MAVDSIEHRTRVAAARPYAVANPQFRDLPLFGEFRGQDNPELVAGLDPQPQLIFKTYSESGYDAVQLQEKTGIPVVVLDYGDLGRNRGAFYETLRLMGTVLGVEERAEAVIRFFEEAIADLIRRAGEVPEAERRSCYVGGIGSRGTHGFQSTEPGYPPFLFLSARNVAADPAKGDKQLRQADIAKEQLLLWDPELVFLDLGTLGSGKEANGLIELRTDPVYRSLSAGSGGNVHGVLPYNSYTTNYGSVLADAYFIGTVLYPDRFSDVRPEAKADEIYTFLVGKPLFAQLDEAFEGLVFKKIPWRSRGCIWKAARCRGIPAPPIPQGDAASRRRPSAGFLFLLALSLGAVSIPPGEVLRTLLGEHVSPRGNDRAPDPSSPRPGGGGGGVGALVGGRGDAVRVAQSSGVALHARHCLGGGLRGAFSVILLGTGVMRSRMADAVQISSPLETTGVAFLFCLLASGIVLLISRMRRASPEAMILAGVALNSLFSAGTMFLQYFATDVQLAAVVFWSFGDVGRAGWRELWIMALVVGVASLFFFRNVWNYNAMDSGDETALGLGVPVARLRMWSLGVASLLTAVVVAFLGVIASWGSWRPT